MNKKLLAALALAVLGLLYLAFQPKGDIPATVEDERPGTTDVGDARITAAPDTTAAPDSEDQSMAGKLVETLHADKQLNAVAVIQSVECADGQCTVELEAKGEESVQPTMLNFLREHPEYGTDFKVAAGENPRSTQFILNTKKM
ncbi:MAG TPA: hypothetical protein VE954_05980 [Oligoflexus sp.]|uniref:hypothetical protein n=1 Tax=Oligoflexus sp. TaxID=1971216 RepID=UPI002D571CC9|nr:hypothetical protein [Oligoflexus sp.]HYX32642.1 hypothetical protein [Oligoflexus sp.]